jgi:hypothetical protein
VFALGCSNSTKVSFLVSSRWRRSKKSGGGQLTEFAHHMTLLPPLKHFDAAYNCTAVFESAENEAKELLSQLNMSLTIP